MKLDLSCPIELRGYTLSGNGKSAVAEARLYNLTDRRIDAIDVVVKWHSSETERSVAMPVTADHLRAAGRSVFQLTFTNDRLPNADSLDLLFTAVRFENGADPWQSGNGTVVSLEPLPFIAPEELSALRACAGEDAVCWPAQQEQTWHCLCGRPNTEDDARCVRCHRSRDEVLKYTPGFVQNARQASQSAALAQEELDTMHADFRRHRKSLFRRTMASALALLTLTSLLLLHTQPAPVTTSENTAMLTENK